MPVSKYYDIIVFTVFNSTLNLVVDVHIVVGGNTGPVHAFPPLIGALFFSAVGS